MPLPNIRRLITGLAQQLAIRGKARIQYRWVNYKRGRGLGVGAPFQGLQHPALLTVKPRYQNAATGRAGRGGGKVLREFHAVLPQRIGVRHEAAQELLGAMHALREHRREPHLIDEDEQDVGWATGCRGRAVWLRQCQAQAAGRCSFEEIASLHNELLIVLLKAGGRRSGWACDFGSSSTLPYGHTLPAISSNYAPMR